MPGCQADAIRWSKEVPTLRPSPSPLFRQPQHQSRTLARALPAPSFWLADALILGLVLALIRLF